MPVKNELRLGADVMARFRKLDTTAVSDAVDKLGLGPCGLLGITPVIQGTMICGQAFTVHYTPCGQVAGTVGDFLDDVEEGQVVVIDNSGRTYATIWGDIMSAVAKKNKVAGTLADGVCRDVPAIRKMGYPVFSKGCYMVTGKDRVYVDAVEVPVSISGMQVKPGDIIMADDSGAIVVAIEKAMEVLEVAEGISKVEEKIVELVLSGMALKEARERTGYHTLQTKGK